MNLFSLENVKALDCIVYNNIVIKEHTFTFITGESGCGKSTLLRIMNLTMIPNEGVIKYRDKPISEVDIIKYRRNVILVPQDVYLIDGTIMDNYNFYYDSLNIPSPDKSRVSEMLKICCMDNIPDMECNTLSGGERQRVFLSIFMSFGSPVLLLDEPTSALDEVTARRLFNNLKEYSLQNNITVLTVCHSEEIAKAYADQIIHIDRSVKNELNC